MLVTNKFYKSIESDLNLKKAERELWRKLCALWVYNGCKHLEYARYPELMQNKNKKISVTIGHKILAKKLSYARSDNLTPAIKSLVEKGYLTYTPGTGVKGQAKNISRLSQFDLNIPQWYELPSIKTLTEEEKTKYTLSNMISLGVDPEQANHILASAQFNKLTDKAQRTHSLKDWIKVNEIRKTLKALNLKAAA